MEKRIGSITILVTDRSMAEEVNRLISAHQQIILCRQGLPFRTRPVAVIVLVVEGTTAEVNALTGPIGRLPGVKCKATLA